MPPTNVWPVNAERPDPAIIARAAAVLRAGELVAFPTETVYGLGANALDPAAVAKIFAAKGRPATNPVIVHVQDAAQAQSLAAEWPEMAANLVVAFWPGPLTLVLQKRDVVPEIVTAGGETVALRCPNHAVALELLRACEFPIAAPSANRSTQLSPTRAEHVVKAFGETIAVLDGGPCRVGIESTVVDATGDTVRLVRPGIITLDMLQRIGPAELAGNTHTAARSPGQMERHYKPRAKIIIIDGYWLIDNLIYATVHEKKAAFLLIDSVPDDHCMYYLPADPVEYARGFFSKLHQIDESGVDIIYVEYPPDTEAWRGNS